MAIKQTQEPSGLSLNESNLINNTTVMGILQFLSLNHTQTGKRKARLVKLVQPPVM
jgi:hypothetical protein